MTVKVKVATAPEYTAEGSYVELVEVYGYEFALHFIAGEIRVYGTKSLAYDRRPKWQLKSAAKLAKEYAAKTIAAFGAEFMTKHNALYAGE